MRPRTVRSTWVVLIGLGLAGSVGAVDDRDPDKAGTETPRPASENARSAAEGRFREDVGYLAADAREGREPGTKGIEMAADYVAGVFKQAGLKPAAGARGYFQPFSIAGQPKLGATQALAFDGPDGKKLGAEFKSDYSPLAVGVGGKLEKVPIVFAGYGITAKDQELKLDYDDYSGIDVKGKAVLVIRREPQQDDDASPFSGRRTTNYATFRHKATNAFQHGAAAVLLVNDSAGLGGEKDKLLGFMVGGAEPNSNIPFVMVSRDFADKLLAGAGEQSLEQSEKQIDRDLKPRSRELKGWTLSGRIDIDRTNVETKNVVGVLEGAGPHAEETIIIGGHYDHLGRGGMMSGSLAFFSNEIHNGADDNASGTAMVLELARRLGTRREPPPRRLVFMAFSGEERGLLGSRHYVEHPLYPLATTVMMFNCDMVGRLNTKEELTMIGTGTSPGLDSLVETLGKPAGLTIKKVSGMSDGFGGSDHQSFYEHGVPVLFAFTGVHRDYHRPSDDSDLINYGGMTRIADYLEKLVLDVLRRPERPAFVKLTEPSRGRMARANDPARAGTSVYLGTRPDYSSESKDGLRLEGVSEGSPAEKGGLKAGDIIVRFGGKPVGTIYDYMESMGHYKAGDKVELQVKRDGKDVTLQVTLGSRPRQ